MAKRLRALALSSGVLRRPLLRRCITMDDTQHPRRREDVVVFVDFDQTITTRDTIGLLFDAARATRTSEELQTAHAQQVNKLVDQFLQESSALSSTALSSSAPPTEAANFDEKGLHRYLEMFAELDLRSIKRVIESETLSLMSHRDLVAISKHVDVMKGCVEVLAVPSRVWVVSANWSQTMIHAKLQQVRLEHAKVIANELKMNARGLTTGDIDLTMQAPTDKAAFVANTAAEDSDAISVYLGDSTNDLLAMLEADIGITLGFAVDSSFVRVCSQFGIQLVSLTAFDSLKSCSSTASSAKDKGERVLFTASSWQDIHAVLTN